jgi:hypothetical protein
LRRPIIAIILMRASTGIGESSVSVLVPATGAQNRCTGKYAPFGRDHPLLAPLSSSPRDEGGMICAKSLASELDRTDISGIIVSRGRSRRGHATCNAIAAADGLHEAEVRWEGIV